MRCSDPSASSWLVASSNTRTLGVMASDAAMASRCFCPPESDIGGRSSRPERPTARSARATDALIAAGSIPRFSGPKAASSSTVPANSCASGSSRTSPTVFASSATSCVRVSAPWMSTEPFTAPPSKWGTTPFRLLQSVDLPLPLGPMTAMSSPGWTRSVTASSAHRSVSGYRNENRRNSTADVGSSTSARTGRVRTNSAEAGAASAAARSARLLCITAPGPARPGGRRRPRRRPARPRPGAGR